MTRAATPLDHSRLGPRSGPTHPARSQADSWRNWPDSVLTPPARFARNHALSVVRPSPSYAFPACATEWGTYGISRKSEDLRPYLRYTTVGLQFCILFMVVLFAGIWVDKRFDTSPWFTLVGTLLGAALAFYTLYKEVFRKDSTEDEPDGPRGPAKRR